MMLFRGDCLEEMLKIPDGSVDLILADIPYGTTACKWDIVIPFEPMWEQIWRVLKPNGACVLFGSEPFSSVLRVSQIKYFKYDWVWKKNTVTGLATAKLRPMKDYELISIFHKAQPIYIPQKTERIWYGKKANTKTYIRKMGQASDHQAGMQKRDKVEYDPKFVNPKMVLEFNTEPNALGKFHPTQKPVALLEYLIKTYTNECEAVLDFTMGSGSTGVAAIQTGRDFIGIEKEDKYFQIAEDRINKAVDSVLQK